jgi:predicted RNA-binding protein with PIN domain
VYKDFPHRKDRVKIVHTIQEDTIDEYMGRMYAALNDGQAEY